VAPSDRDEAESDSGHNPEGEPMEPLLTPDQVSDILGIPAKTLANWRSARQGPEFVRIGVHVRYRRSALEKWLDEQAAETTRAWRAS
jgi:predicted DNA-binding transcriptional regulator AlpA